MKLSELRQDIVREAEGADVELPCGVTVCVARMENPRAEALKERLYLPHRHAFRRGKIPPREVRDRVDINVIAHEVLKGWDLQDDDGALILCTPERVTEILSDAHYRDLFEEIREAASYRETFRREEIEEAEKNSGRPPAGSSSGGRSLKNSKD